MSHPPDGRRFIDALAPALRQAAAIARALEGRVRNRPKAEESSAAKQALTVADTATQEAILVPLLEHFPDLCVEAEEDTPTVGRFPKSGEGLVVIDPIDGTLHSYLAGEGPYAVMVGLALRRRYEAGLLALPREGLFFRAARGHGARMARAGGRSRPVRLERDGDRVLVSNGMPAPVFARLRELGADPVPACGGAVAIAPLIPGVRAGLRLATSPRGVSVQGRIGALISTEAGALVRSRGGAPFPDDLDTPAPHLLVTAVEEDLELLDEALAAAP
jgi:hypothetical protein